MDVYHHHSNPKSLDCLLLGDPRIQSQKHFVLARRLTKQISVLQSRSPAKRGGLNRHFVREIVSEPGRNVVVEEDLHAAVFSPLSASSSNSSS
jgi:hypothetical protein